MDGQEVVNQEVFRRLDKLDKQYEKLDDKVGNLDVRMTSIETENKHQTELLKKIDQAMELESKKTGAWLSKVIIGGLTTGFGAVILYILNNVFHIVGK